MGLGGRLADSLRVAGVRSATTTRGRGQLVPNMTSSLLYFVSYEKMKICVNIFQVNVSKKLSRIFWYLINGEKQTKRE